MNYEYFKFLFLFVNHYAKTFSSVNNVTKRQKTKKGNFLQNHLSCLNPNR
jgi:hypothetical protein